MTRSFFCVHAKINRGFCVQGIKCNCFRAKKKPRISTRLLYKRERKLFLFVLFHFSFQTSQDIIVVT